MKLWKCFVNNGGWNGFHTLHCLAETETEAREKMDVDHYISMGYTLVQFGVASGDDIFQSLGIFDREKQGYKLEYSIVKD